jgi:hypothetical protein
MSFISFFFVFDCYFLVGKNTKSSRDSQKQNQFNSLKIKYIKMTFLDIKVADFKIKIANCKENVRRRL